MYLDLASDGNDNLENNGEGAPKGKKTIIDALVLTSAAADKSFGTVEMYLPNSPWKSAYRS